MKTIRNLNELNPSIHPDELAVYLNAKKLYSLAAAHIEKNGAVNDHPKTGTPKANPYLAVRYLAGKTILKFHRDNPDFQNE